MAVRTKYLCCMPHIYEWLWVVESSNLSGFCTVCHTEKFIRKTVQNIFALVLVCRFSTNQKVVCMSFSSFLRLLQVPQFMPAVTCKISVQQLHIFFCESSLQFQNGVHWICLSQHIFSLVSRSLAQYYTFWCSFRQTLEKLSSPVTGLNSLSSSRPSSLWQLLSFYGHRKRKCGDIHIFSWLSLLS